MIKKILTLNIILTLSIMSCATLGPKTGSKEVIHVCEKREKFLDIKYSYCYDSSNDSQDMIVYMHGAFSSAKAWTKPAFFSTKKFLEVKIGMKKQPKALTISFGRSWMLTNQTERDKRPKYATIENFMKVLGHLERKHFRPKRRFLVGISMGGHNALQLYLHKPKMWDRAVIVNPLQTECHPFDRLDVKCMWGNTTKQSTLSHVMVRANYESRALYDANSPAGAGAQFASSEHPPLQLHIAENDEFKFTEGGIAIFKALLGRGVPIEAVVNPGDHKDMGVTKIIDFLDMTEIVSDLSKKSPAKNN